MKGCNSFLRLLSVAVTVQTKQEEEVLLFILSVVLNYSRWIGTKGKARWSCLTNVGNAMVVMNDDITQVYVENLTLLLKLDSEIPCFFTFARRIKKNKTMMGFVFFDVDCWRACTLFYFVMHVTSFVIGIVVHRRRVMVYGNVTSVVKVEVQILVYSMHLDFFLIFQNVFFSWWLWL